MNKYNGVLVKEMVLSTDKCPCCIKQRKGIKGAMHTKLQWKKYHPTTKDQSIDPLVKSHK